MSVLIQLPSDLEKRLRSVVPNLDAQCLEASVLELFRCGAISHNELAITLGMDRFQADSLLKKHNVSERQLTIEDLDEQGKTLDRVLGTVRRK